MRGHVGFRCSGCATCDTVWIDTAVLSFAKHLQRTRATRQELQSHCLKAGSACNELNILPHVQLAFLVTTPAHQYLRCAGELLY